MNVSLKMGETGDVGGDTAFRADLSSSTPLVMLTTSWLNWILFFSWTLLVTATPAVCLMALFRGAAFTGGGGGGGGEMDADDEEETGDTEVGTGGALTLTLTLAFCSGAFGAGTVGAGTVGAVLTA